jgi:hypothetical protein
MDVNDWMSRERSDEGTHTQNIHYSSTRSHVSEEEYRTRNRSENYKCKHALRYMTISQAPFTSEIVGLILATDSCEKSQSILYRKSLVFFGCSSSLPQGKLTGWVRINTVRKVITIVVKINSLG